MTDPTTNPPDPKGLAEVKAQLTIAADAIRKAVAAIRGAYTALVASGGYLLNEATQEWGALVQFVLSLFGSGG